MILVNGKQIKLEKFPDGTPHMYISVAPSTHYHIYWKYEAMDEMVTLYFAAKHLRTLPLIAPDFRPPAITLDMPYIPNARMDRVDRVKDNSEVFTLKHFCDFINDLNFQQVSVLDAHSNTSLALLNNVQQNAVFPYIQTAARRCNPDMLFFPDKGSHDRYKALIQNTVTLDDALKALPKAFGNKKRDWDSGKILEFNVECATSVTGKIVLIVDDICSRGKTFYHSAQKLKELGADKIYLYVTHCENSILTGELLSSELIEHIFTSESIFTEQHDKITVIASDDADFIDCKIQQETSD